MYLKKIFKAFCPYGLILYRQKRHTAPCIYGQRCHSWSEAKNLTQGYESKDIVEKVLESTQAVIDGNAVFERDSVLFYEDDYNWPLLTGLLFSNSKLNGKLSILDFGGSLGSTFWQNRKILEQTSSKLNWHIVEQPGFYKAASQLQYKAPLFFHQNIEDAYHFDPGINVVLFSSVLQYLENWRNIIDDILIRKPDFIILDRTPVFRNQNEGEYRIQIVADSICKGSYPSFIFGKNQLNDLFKDQYSCIFSSKSVITPACHLNNEQCIDFMGYVFQRRQAK